MATSSPPSRPRRLTTLTTSPSNSRNSQITRRRIRPGAVHPLDTMALHLRSVESMTKRLWATPRGLDENPWGT